jgi:hypothetical protein
MISPEGIAAISEEIFGLIGTGRQVPPYSNIAHSGRGHAQVNGGRPERAVARDAKNGVQVGEDESRHNPSFRNSSS